MKIRGLITFIPLALVVGCSSSGGLTADNQAASPGGVESFTPAPDYTAPTPAFTSATPKPYEPGYCEANPTVAICNLGAAAPVTQAPAPAQTQPPAAAETASQSEAVSKAQSYLSISGFSRTGLIQQLVYDQFSDADATYAVDQVGADWNAEAAQKAKEYLSISSFSHQGLVDQLTYDGFTPAEAESGVTQAGL
jgi:hypothetical protein